MRKIYCVRYCPDWLLLGFVGEAVAQPQINRSAYFLGGATYRHELNLHLWEKEDMLVCPD